MKMALSGNDVERAFRTLKGVDLHVRPIRRHAPRMTSVVNVIEQPRRGLAAVAKRDVDVPGQQAWTSTS